ncbi:diguanylate cyclase/phosphodiesterase with PAS/PAC sensor(s) [mine drainage metagenome]|uniref:Diguanylate cyclase/phosphodiesterase with PAS/PAC sensor(S) n=2 Tax=mine drainage metagenome TaxID=410659 RepID=T1C5S2_9ZZZZ
MNASRSDKPIAIPLARQLRPLLVGMLLIVLLVLVLTWIALQVQVAVAGLLNGESIWSKAEKQAVIDLYAYAETGSADHLAAFRRQVQIVADYRVARDALASAEPNYRAIEQVLVRTGALRESIPGGLFVLRHFAHTPYIHNALESWRATDAGMDELQRLAVESQAAYATGAPSAVQRAAITRRILAINQHIAP